MIITLFAIALLATLLLGRRTPPAPGTELTPAARDRFTVSSMLVKAPTPRMPAAA